MGVLFAKHDGAEVSRNSIYPPNMYRSGFSCFQGVKKHIMSVPFSVTLEENTRPTYDRP
jgi:hypothetical protein